MRSPLRLVVSAVLLLGACERSGSVAEAPTKLAIPSPPLSSPSPPENVELRGAGSTFVNPIMQKWIATFSEQSPTRVTYGSVGSSEGVRQIAAREVDFGATDVAMTNEELASAPAAIVQIPVTLGSVVVAYNRQGLADHLKLSKDAIAGIFLGDIKKWNDARIASTNPDVRLPDLEIAVNVRSDGSGTTAVFTKYLSDVSPRWSGYIGAGKTVKFPVGKWAKGNEGVAREISRARGPSGTWSSRTRSRPISASAMRASKIPPAGSSSRTSRARRPRPSARRGTCLKTCGCRS